MRHTTPSKPWSIPRLPLNVAFVAVACSLVFVLATAGTAIPLYNTYRTQDGITNADLGWCSVAYFVSAATSLLVLGQLSNPLGSRLVAIAVLASAALSCLVLMGMYGMISLTVAWVLQGLACCIASRWLGFYVVDSAVSPSTLRGSRIHKRDPRFWLTRQQERAELLSTIYLISYNRFDPRTYGRYS